MDVWLANSRGNLYGRSHMLLDLFDTNHRQKFWDFSWADIGQYDLPGVIDYIKRQTRYGKVAYVGYS